MFVSSYQCENPNDPAAPGAFLAGPGSLVVLAISGVWELRNL